MSNSANSGDCWSLLRCVSRARNCKCMCVRARHRRREGREALFSCLPAKIGADPLCSENQIQVKFNPSWRSNPCQSLSQAARLTDLHFQHHGERHNARRGENHTRTRSHIEQITRKLWADDISDSDLLVCDDGGYFEKQIISMTKTTCSCCKSPSKRNSTTVWIISSTLNRYNHQCSLRAFLSNVPLHAQPTVWLYLFLHNPDRWPL